MKNLVTFFYQPNILRKSEANFFRALVNRYPNSQVLNLHFLVPEESLEQFIDKEKLLSWLQSDTFLPPKKREACIGFLKTSPSQLRVALNPKEISFDVVAKFDEKIFYWEFHEKQHARLSVDRTKYVYAADGSRVEVPRYFQRFVRDIWRALYFRPYTIVWQDWFEKSEDQSKCLELQDGFREFSSNGKFSLQKLVANEDF